MGWGKRATDHLQQGRFAAAITPDDTDGFAFFDFKGNVFERPEFTKILPRRSPGKALQARSDNLLKTFARVLVDVAVLTEVFNFDGYTHSGFTP